jgi:hypothetical protein
MMDPVKTKKQAGFAPSFLRKIENDRKTTKQTLRFQIF